METHSIRKDSFLIAQAYCVASSELLPNGQYKMLADRFEGHRFNSPNDVVIGPDRAIYFTDPTLDLPSGQKQEIPFKGCTALAKMARVELLIRDMSQPNGLAFSPDGKRLYVDDSEQKNIRVFDFQRMPASQTAAYLRKKRARAAYRMA